MFTGKEFIIRTSRQHLMVFSFCYQVQIHVCKCMTPFLINTPIFIPNKVCTCNAIADSYVGALLGIDVGVGAVSDHVYS